jgi:hypothetical protein
MLHGRHAGIAHEILSVNLNVRKMKYTHKDP